MDCSKYTMFSLLLLCALLEIIHCQQSVGDSCTTKTDVPGVCELITDCSSALKSIHVESPQICGFIGTQPIVCCVDSKRITQKLPKPNIIYRKPSFRPPSRSFPVVTPPIVRKSSKTTTTAPTLLRVGDKSKAKCKEYGRYVYEYVTVGGAPSEECGIVDVQLVVGGTKAKPKEFPHMAVIGYDGANNEKIWQCGGSLISDQYVLTAAHCLLDSEDREAKYVRIGDLVLSSTKDDAEPQEFTVIEALRHPKYSPPAQYHDIALLKLNRKVRLNPYVRPACLNVEPNLDLTRKPIATGFGQIGYSHGASDALLKVSLEYFEHSKCNRSYQSNVGFRLPKGIKANGQLCAGSHKFSNDTCQGDSGGPLQIVGKEVFCTYSIVGVTSFGKGCGIPDIPAIYTRVSEYIDWIESTVWP